MKTIWGSLCVGLISVLLAGGAAEAIDIRPGALLTLFPTPPGWPENPFPNETVCEAVREVSAGSPSRERSSSREEVSPRWEFRCQVPSQSQGAPACRYESVVLNLWDLMPSPMKAGRTEIPMARAGVEVLAGSRVVRAESFGRTEWRRGDSFAGSNFYWVRDQSACWHAAKEHAPAVRHDNFPEGGFRLGERVYISNQERKSGSISEPLELHLIPTTVVGWAAERDFWTCFDDTGARCRDFWQGQPFPGVPYPAWVDAPLVAYWYVFDNGLARNVPYRDGEIVSGESDVWRPATEREIGDLPPPGSQVMHLFSERFLTIRDWIVRGPARTQDDSGQPLNFGFSEDEQGRWISWSDSNHFALLRRSSSRLNVRRDDLIRGDLVVIGASGTGEPGDERISRLSDEIADSFVSKIEDKPIRFTFAITENGKRYILANCEEDRWGAQPSGPVLGPRCDAERQGPPGRPRSIYAIQIP